MVIACDFDNVIHDKAHPIEGRRMGGPMPGAVEAMSKLSTNHTLIIHTVMAATRAGGKTVQDWLEYYNVPFNDITAVKPNADVYLDDKALKFTDWETALNDIKGLSGGRSFNWGNL